jgi:hypothetical protein
LSIAWQLQLTSTGLDSRDGGHDSALHACRGYAQVARACEQRCTYLAELQASGRWTRYYGKEQFLACMAEALELARVSQLMLRAAEQVPGPALTEQPTRTAN